MSSSHFKADQVKGYQDIIDDEFSSLNYLALSKLLLKEDEEYKGLTTEYEAVLVILTGKASVSCGGNHWSELGERNKVFEGKATVVYIPCQTEYKVIADSDVCIAVCKAKAEEKFKPFIVQPDDIVVNQRGGGNWNREVHDIIPDSMKNRVQRIIVGETFNSSGEWSSYPPHKHDRDNYPEEVDLEEIYHYQIEPEQGFGVQLRYTNDGITDEAYTVRNGDSFAISEGYHPIVCCWRL
ncbi:5-deoxy-glucuronate isomerase [Virgibacillus halotolerans]|uniref:5-deoxy-glucuronate isomerase n=1 Tax=Virgibacillus halotolerans TaxID=1071053 RepID=UPI0023BAAE12|nr:5-deoxy-glucuronate isomerase [Virgibacillus halotolerans]MBM7599043.1 5-deoxy-glucuronate isomerase [Virgibacillus halotolerans]